MSTTIATDIEASFLGVKITGDVIHDAGLHTLSLTDPEGPASVISINLEGYGLVPMSDDTVFIKDWSENTGLTDSLVAAGVVRVIGEHEVGPFRSRAYEVRVLAFEEASA